MTRVGGPEADLDDEVLISTWGLTGTLSFWLSCHLLAIDRHSSVSQCRVVRTGYTQRGKEGRSALHECSYASLASSPAIAIAVGRQRLCRLADMAIDVQQQLATTFMTEFERRLQESSREGRPLILDGGTGTTLWSILGQRIQSELWSARILADNPLAVYDVCLAFASSGADIIGTCTYQGHLAGYVKELGCTYAEAAAFLLSGVHIAAKARDDFLALSPPGTTKPMIGLNLGPFGATLCDSQEYQGNYPPPFGPSTDRFAASSYPSTPLGQAAAQRSERLLCDWHLARLRLYLTDPATASQIDILIFETVPLLREMRAIRAAVAMVELETGRHWPFTLSAVMSKGIPVETGATHAEYVDTVVSPSPPQAIPGIPYAVPLLIGLNCVDTARLPALVQATAYTLRDMLPAQRPNLILYPNNEYETRLDEEAWTARMIEVVEQVKKTQSFSGLVIGGCCGVTPSYIQMLSEQIKGAGS